MHVLRSDIHCVKYAKIPASSDPYFPDYDSVLVGGNTDTILSMCQEKWIKEILHFGIFYAVIRKKYQDFKVYFFPKTNYDRATCM